MSRNSADAAEITQEAFCKVYSDFHQFRGDASFDTWIYRIVSNIAVDRARRSRRLLVLESLFWPCGESRSPSAEQELLLSELQEEVRRAMASLPLKFRIPTVLRYIEELSYEQISTILNCPPGTIAARINRARKLLAKKLESLRR